MQHFYLDVINCKLLILHYFGLRGDLHVIFSKVILINGVVFVDLAVMEVLDCSVGAADEDSAVEVLVGAVLVHLAEAFPAAAPVAFEADVDEVGQVLAELALADEETHLAQALGQRDEELGRTEELQMERWRRL